MGKIIESPWTDEELEAEGITIPETETDTSLFDWINDTIEEVLADVKTKFTDSKA